MKRFVEGADRGQTTLLPECLCDWVEESNPVRAVDVFVEALDLGDLGFNGVPPLATGRPAYHPSTLLKLYIYGYLNRVQSSRRLEREARDERAEVTDAGYRHQLHFMLGFASLVRMPTAMGAASRLRLTISRPG